MPETKQPEARILSTRAPADLRAAIEQLADEERRTVSQMTLILLEEGVEGRGRMPPSDARRTRRGRPRQG